jgi:hypothetical protein
MPYLIKQFGTNKYKVCKKNNLTKCFSKKPLTLEKAKKQLKAIGMNEHKISGTGKNKFFEQLKEINLTPKKYLDFVKFVAKNRNYNPDLLKFSDDGTHKLEYNNIPFGRVGYNDKIIYSWLEINNKVEQGTAKKKYSNYRKRAKKIMMETNNKFSPASLSFYLLW